MLPAAAYSFAKGMRAPWPAPPAFALAALGMLVQTRTDWKIYGGNIASTLAGEFSFAIALAFALFALGALAYTLDTGQAALAARGADRARDHVAHRRRDLRRRRGGRCSGSRARPQRTWPIAVPVGAVGVALTAVWSLPLLVATGVHAEHAVREGVLDRQLVQACRRGSSLPEPGEAHDRGPRARRRARPRRTTGKRDLADAVVAVVDLGRSPASRSSPPVGTGAARRSCCIADRARRSASSSSSGPSTRSGTRGSCRSGCSRGRSSRRWARPRSLRLVAHGVTLGVPRGSRDGDLARRARPRVGRRRAPTTTPTSIPRCASDAVAGARRAAASTAGRRAGSRPRISTPTRLARRSRADRDDRARGARRRRRRLRSATARGTRATATRRSRSRVGPRGTTRATRASPRGPSTTRS